MWWGCHRLLAKLMVAGRKEDGVPEPLVSDPKSKKGEKKREKKKNLLVLPR